MANESRTKSEVLIVIEELTRSYQRGSITKATFNETYGRLSQEFEDAFDDICSTMQPGCQCKQCSDRDRKEIFIA